MHRLLAAFAHPDDEALIAGGTLAKYAAANVHTALICATRGEAGEIAPGTDATPETLGQVREAELRCAAEMLGAREVYFLDYRDSGMAGTPENEHPRSLNRADATVLTRELVQRIREFKPDVVVTFDETGGYGHPDHIAMHRCTTAAFRAAGDAHQFPEAGEPWQPGRLFYTSFPRSLLRQMREQAHQLGINVAQFDNPEFERMGLSEEEITVIVDVSSQLDIKWQAFQCHRTQIGPDNLFRRVPHAVLKQLMGSEYFVQALPQPNGRTAKGDDLFAGLATGTA